MDKIEKLKELKYLLESGVIDQNEFSQLKSEILGAASENVNLSTNQEEVKIGDQIWSTKNLDVNTFRNGDVIFEAKTNNDWEAAGNNEKPAWCFYDNDPVNGKKYGRLYNWFAVIDPRGLTPKGWHIPSDRDWSKLIEKLGGNSAAGMLMKTTTNWNKNGNGTNQSGFAALPSGLRDLSGTFDNIGNEGNWWCHTEGDTSLDCFHIISYNDNGVFRSNYCKPYGFSVRCLRDF